MADDAREEVHLCVETFSRPYSDRAKILVSEEFFHKRAKLLRVMATTVEQRGEEWVMATYSPTGLRYEYAEALRMFTDGELPPLKPEQKWCIFDGPTIKYIFDPSIPDRAVNLAIPT
jgi:hypothetical protein